MGKTYVAFLRAAILIMGARPIRGGVMLRIAIARVSSSSGLLARVALAVALVALMLPAVLSPSRAADAATGANPVVDENQLPGTAQWQLGKEADDVAKQIKGYASAASVNLGATIDFFVTVKPAQTYTIDIYRIGYYQGLGGRLVQHVDPLPGVVQPACPMDAVTGMISCNWALGYQLTVPTTWTSGVFLAKLTNSNGFQNYVPFTVRDDGRGSDLLYQQSVSTYQAYNNYPNDVPSGSSVPATGKSLYDYNSSTTRTSLGTQRAVKVSYDRPYNDNGAGQFLDFEIYFIRWMEQNGYDATYSTNVDTDLNGARLRDHRGFLSVGHDEYWSKTMFDSVAAARDNGVGLGFFGGNSVYWQVRFEPSASGQPDRVMVCYKDVNLDPVKDATTTSRWRDAPLNRPEQQLMGGMTTGQQPDGVPPAAYVVTNSSNWIYAGTGLRDGDKIPGVVGYEADRYINGQTPPTVAAGSYFTLSSSPFMTTRGTTDYQQSTIYQAPSGAWVFGAGSIEWSWGLYNDGSQVYADPRIQQITANVLNRIAAGALPLPSAATNFTAVPSGTAVHLSWTAASGADTYVLDRSSTPTFGMITSITLPADATTYDDTGLAADVYYYRIRAVNANGNSPYATTSAATTSYTALVSQRSGLLANWRLGEANGTTAWDTTGAYNGSFVGGPGLGTPGAIANDPDTAVTFDGSTNRVTVPSLPNAVDFTIEGWTYLTSTANVNHTLYGGNGTVRILARPGPSISTTTAYAGVWLNGTEYVLQPSIAGTNVNTWVHWALTRDGNILTFYRNGTAIGERTDLPATAPANLSGYLGAQIGGAYYLTGRIDEVAVYREVLSSADVANDYTAGINGLAPAQQPPATTSYRDTVLAETSLAAYWRLGETSGTAATDSKGTANGTYVNGVTLGAPDAIANDPNTAATFNGTNQRVSLPTLGTATDFSIEGWTNLTNASSTNNTMYGTNANVRLMPRPGNSTTPTAAYAGVWLGGTEYYIQPNSPAPNVNTWVHWVMTRQGNTLTLYRNASLIGQRTDLPATATANISGFIGAQGGSAFFLAGSIDDVAVYQSALSAASVTKHYKAGLYGPAPN
jgi:N,N-dimethylformamidase beta subunit-like, C-terminal/Concanavalin A-like lectin/glucanases superfamily